MNNIFHDKTILITGGTGSLGKTLVKRILSNEQGEVKKLIIFSRDEAKQHAMRVNFANEKSATDEITYTPFDYHFLFFFLFLLLVEMNLNIPSVLCLSLPSLTL